MNVFSEVDIIKDIIIMYININLIIEIIASNVRENANLQAVES